MGLRDPEDVEAYERRLAEISVEKPARLSSKIHLSDYDPTWPTLYAREEARIRRLLGHRALRVEHVGSTSVPGLAAKPIIDIALEVQDSSDETSFVPDLEAAGYRLSVREPDWYEHRLLKGPDTNVNVHVFSAGCEETERMVLLRDWLRSNGDDRELYARAKRELAARDWQFVQQYADAKSDVLASIMKRAITPPHATT